MSTSVGYSFISAKLHGMRARMYELERLDALTTLRTPFEMMGTIYPRIEDRSLRTFERRLAADHVRELYRVLRQLRGDAKEFFSWQLERYRVENIKVILRAWKAKQSLEEIEPFLVELPERYALPVEKLLGASKLTDFAPLLPKRRFVDGVLRGAVQFQETGKLFYVEAGLDAAYFRQLCRLASLLGEADREEVHRAIRTEVLIYNVLFAFRARLNYGVEPEAVTEFMARGPMPSPTGADFESLIRAEGFPAMLAALPDRKVLLGAGPDPADVEDLQRRLWQKMYVTANHAFYGSVMHLGVVEGFYYVKRIELSNLIRVAELLRQGKTGEDIERELIRLPEE